MDPQHPDFRSRCEANPALITRCSMLWEDGWGPEGMASVPGALLKEVIDTSHEDEDDDLIPQLISVHQSMLPKVFVRRVHSTRVHQIRVHL